MQGDIIPYSTTTLLGVQTRVIQPFSFWLQFFTQTLNFDTETISFEKVQINNRGLAPFVAPNVQAAYNRLDGYDAAQFKPGYIKEKDVVDINMPFFRQAGETPVSGSLSPNQRRAAIIAKLTQDHVTRIHNRFEWMASQAIQHAAIEISGERYTKSVLSFGRDPNLTLTTDWTEGKGGNGFNDIKRMRVLSNRLCGSEIRINIFGADAWDAFYKLHKEELKDLLDTRYRGSDTNITKLIDGFDGIEYVGDIVGLNGAGRIKVFINTMVYTDEKGATQYFQDQGSVVGIDPNAFSGVRCFGAIRDGRADYKSMEIFPKNWVNGEDPYEELIMHQSAPLMVPLAPNATYYIKAV